jgi:hypothetical protein
MIKYWNVHGMCLIVVLLLEKVLVLIGGMPITGIMLQLEMGIGIVRYVKIPGLALKFISETKILPLLLTRSTNAT